MDSGFPRSVALYGTGLMGCSLALALKRHFPSIRIHGIDHPAVLEIARRRGAIDEGEALQPELVVLAAPIGDILQLLQGVPAATPLILDIGSTKTDICRVAESRNLRFIGSHPMTGSERSGPEAASADLFQGFPFFICPVATTPEGATPMIAAMASTFGATPHVIEAAQHDRLMAELSHLPQLLSTLLADHTAANRPLAGPGLKSMTRLAASPFDVWRDILKTSAFVPQELRAYLARLQSALAALEAGDFDTLDAIFQRANASVSPKKES